MKGLKIVILVVLVVHPFMFQAQVVSCKKNVLKKTKTDRWEKVDYRLRVFDFNDTSIMQETARILSYAKSQNVDSLVLCGAKPYPYGSERAGSILIMRFRSNGADTLVCYAEYTDSPYLWDDLIGCCKIEGYYVQIIGVMPYFMTPTKETVSFSYIRHIMMGNYGLELEDMSDDSAPKWIIEFSNNHVKLLKYYGMDN